MMRPMFGAHSSVVANNCISFISNASVLNVKTYGLNKRIEPIKNVRKVRKKDMKWNNFLPKITVDPETYSVQVEGKKIEMGPCDTVPMQSVFLF